MSLLSEKDQQFVWHPFTQEKTAAPAIPIVKGDGIWLITEDGKRIMDVNSSWWTTIHGHAHPYIAERIYEQCKTLEHVIFAGITHPKAIELAERVIKLLSGNFQKVFFSDNGSTSVEVALKMVYQYHYNQGEIKKRFLAVEGAYHGDTFGAMSVGQRGHFNKPFEHLFFEVDYLPFPTLENENELLQLTENYFKTGEFAGFIFEPLVQGAAGMRIYKPEILNKLITLAKKYNVVTIADEVMTGFYRTGNFFAINYLSKHPDIICLSKGLTGGTMPLGLTVASSQIYTAFYDTDLHKAFLHGHSFTGNPLACAAAIASLDLLEKEETILSVKQICEKHIDFVNKSVSNPNFESVKSLGTILSITLKTVNNQGYFDSIRDKAYHYFIDKGLLIRPIGNIVFVNPPYCINSSELSYIYQTITDFAETLNQTPN